MARDPRDTSRRGSADRPEALLTATLGAEPVPSLAPGFEERLARRLAVDRELDEARERARSPRIAAPGRWLLHLYWAAAAAASLAILGRTDLAAVTGPAGSVLWALVGALLVTGAGLAIPYVALRRAGGSFLGLLRRAL